MNCLTEWLARSVETLGIFYSMAGKIGGMNEQGASVTPNEARIAGSAVMCFVMGTILLVVEYFPLGRERAGWQSRGGQWDDSGSSVVFAIVLYGIGAICTVLCLRSCYKRVAE